MQNNIINNWLIEEGKEKDVVLSSRIRLARNLEKFKFPNKSNLNDKKEVINYLEKKLNFLVEKKFDFYLMADLSKNQRSVLHEQYLISKDHSTDPKNKALFLNNDLNISIMVNEEDHLRLQILKAGLDFDDICSIINALDTDIDQKIDYAFSGKWGYLTSCPTNVGTALRASVMCHLPGLVGSGRIDNILNAAGKFGLTVRGISGEGSSSEADLFQISNQITLGFSEKEIIEKLKSIIQQIIFEERKSRNYLIENNFLELKDDILRSLGLLKYAYKLDQFEALKYLSKIKFGQDTKLIEENIKKDLFSELFFKIKDEHLKYYFDQDLDNINLKIKRAEFIRNILNEE